MRVPALWLLTLACASAADAPATPAPAPAVSAPSVSTTAAAIPPSPSTAPGIRIWPEPAFTHWPAVVYPDEQRNVAFGLPIRAPGAKGSIGWHDQPPLPFTLPNDLERISGLLPLPGTPGTWQAELKIADGTPTNLALRVVAADQPWPLAALRDGFPVDEHGVPVVLLDHRRDANDERKWKLLTAIQRPRPSGQALVVGDLLSGLGSSAFAGLDARMRVATDDRMPTHAQLVGVALDMATWAAAPLVQGPKTILWSPGNQALLANTWSQEEERFLGVVRTRCEALGVFPRLTLVLPPAPIDDRAPARELAVQRRDQLRRAAANQGWVVLDVARIAGEAEESYKVADRVFAEGPVGEGRERLAAALRSELAR